MFRIARLVATLAAILVIASCTGETPETGEKVLGMLPPEDYRARIDAIEAVLYQATPPGYGDADRADRALRDLHTAIIERERSPVVRAAAAGLLFVARADASDIGYAAPRLDAARARWESTRRELFGDAAWFRRSTADVAASQTPEPPRLDPGDVQSLERVIDRLEALIDEGRRECAELGEPVYEPGMEGLRGQWQVDAWNAFHRDWDMRVTTASRRLPPRPGFAGDTAYLFAYQEVERAINELRIVPSGVGSWATPFQTQWSSRLDTARDHLDTAREHLLTLR